MSRKNLLNQNRDLLELMNTLAGKGNETELITLGHLLKEKHPSLIKSYLICAKGWGCPDTLYNELEEILQEKLNQKEE